MADENEQNIVTLNVWRTIYVMLAFLLGLAIGMRLAYPRGFNDGGWEATHKCREIFAPEHKHRGKK